MRHRRSEDGYAAVLVALVVSTLGIACAAIGVDTAMWYVEVQKVQKAADAAALGAVPYLPQDLPRARTRALEIAAANGYDNDGTTNTVTVTQGNPATQLTVEIDSVVTNQFGTMIGVVDTTVGRSATADYQGPAPMGSPCNTFGNEPDAGSRPASPQPSGSAQGSDVPANCPRAPSFWANVEGPETGKVQGDRYQTLGCESAEVDGCTGLTNDEYNEFGYVFLVKVQPEFFDAGGAPRSSIDLQLYDPQFTNVGQTCALLPPPRYYELSNNTWQERNTFPSDADAANPWVSNAEARNRYVAPGNSATRASFCTGDSAPGAATGNAPVTSFVLRQQTDTLNPKLAPVVSSDCIRQYGAASLPTEEYRRDYPQNDQGGNVATRLDADAFRDGTAKYQPQLSGLFHNWSSMCSFTPDRPGDYYLQVRTNVSLGGSTSGFTSTGNLAAAAVTGNTAQGSGSNAFAIRAVTGAGLQRLVSVSGNDHMPIFVNKASGTAEFNLIRVLPGARGQKISFSYFDAGDAQASGSVRVLPPTDIQGSGVSAPFPGGCTTYGGSADTATATAPQALSGCSAPFQKKPSSPDSKNNGRTQTITIPIPADYTCSFADFDGCWYRVQVAFGSGTVTDVTTWDASILGDPVRLVE